MIEKTTTENLPAIDQKHLETEMQVIDLIQTACLAERREDDIQRMVEEGQSPLVINKLLIQIIRMYHDQIKNSVKIISDLRNEKTYKDIL